MIAPCSSQRLPDPFGEGHALPAGDILKFLVFILIQEDLKAFSHVNSLPDSPAIGLRAAGNQESRIYGDGMGSCLRRNKRGRSNIGRTGEITPIPSTSSGQAPASLIYEEREGTGFRLGGRNDGY